MPAPDRFSGYDPGLSGRLTRFAVVTPNDSADLTFCPRAVYFGAAGNVVFWPKDSITPVTVTVTAGQREPWAIDRILATGTTVAASSIMIAD
jgi:hypothetical protein